MRFRALAGGVTLFCLVLLGGIRPAAQSPEPPPDPTAGFFNDDVVQEVRLTLNSKDWSALKANFGSNTFYPCQLTWQGITLKNVGIRSRGNGSRSGTKPGLRVDIDHYAPGQRFLTVKSFVLRNNTQDASNMHERLAMKLLGRMDFAAPREAFARLYVNNTFSGLYTIVEAIDKPFLTRAMGENDGYLYSTTTTPATSRTAWSDADPIPGCTRPSRSSRRRTKGSGSEAARGDDQDRQRDAGRRLPAEDGRLHGPERVHAVCRRRELSRRDRRHARRLGDQQLLYVSPRALDAVGPIPWDRSLSFAGPGILDLAHSSTFRRSRETG